MGYIKEADLPIVKVAKATSNPYEVMKIAFGGRQMKTLRTRARSWKRVREWLLGFCGGPFPRDASYMLEYLLFLIQEDAAKGRLQDTAASLAVLEKAGQVHTEFRISCGHYVGPFKWPLWHASGSRI